MATFRSSTLTFNALWEAFGTEFGLLPDLALDAVLARYKQGELECIPRIVELVCTHSVPLAESAAALAMVDLQPLSSSQRRAVEATLDRWWLWALSVPADDAPADADSGSANSVTDILGILAGFDAPMRRWLHVWLENFDGVGAKLFTEAVLHHATDTTESQAWRGKHDEWTQFQAWCRAEPTVMGFALVGGTHVDQQDVTAVLEQLV